MLNYAYVPWKKKYICIHIDGIRTPAFYAGEREYWEHKTREENRRHLIKNESPGKLRGFPLCL